VSLVVAVVMVACVVANFFALAHASRAADRLTDDDRDPDGETG
jgi:hypothetical protein